MVACHEIAQALNITVLGKMKANYSLITSKNHSVSLYALLEYGQLSIWVYILPWDLYVIKTPDLLSIYIVNNAASAPFSYWNWIFLMIEFEAKHHSMYF